MTLSAGTRLGPYEILSGIGAGGMGEVYKATDTRLDRVVAVKTLALQVAAAPEFRDRFEREARVISQLSHANICTLFDVGEQDGTAFLVMEHLEGETLAARIAKGPIPIEQALPWAIQIAGALHAAHRRGVLHRDLKPGNVMLTPGGVKLLDFGLAKVVGPAATASSAVSKTATPTMMSPLTAQGTILGTFQYMAPEMVEGEEADARADIWAFGCLLFEMLTGRRAFAGKTQASLFGAILKEDAPSISATQPFVPPAIDRLIRNCLEKDPNQRIQSAHDLLLNLQWIAEGGSAVGTPAPVLARRKSRERLMWAGGVLAAAVVAAAAAWAAKPAPAPSDGVTRFVHALATDQRFTRTGRHVLALSPDGTFFVFVANGQLFLRRMNELEAQPIKGSEEDPLEPVVSPDGQWVAYFVAGNVTTAPPPAGRGGQAGGQAAAPGGQPAQGAPPAEARAAAPARSPATLKKIPVTGGASMVLASLSFPLGVSWQGETIAVGQGQDGIVAVPAGGGTPRQLVTLQEGDRGASLPQLIDGGRTLLFSLAKQSASTCDQLELVVQPVEGGERRVVVSGGYDGRLASGGQLVYASGGTLFGARFDERRAERIGDAVPLVVGVTTASSCSAQYSLSAEGRLAYWPGASQVGFVPRTLVWADRQGREQPIPAEPREYIYPSVSPSGKVVALDATADGARDIWMWDVEHDILSRLTSQNDRSDKRGPVWSPDGRTIFYSSTVEGRALLLRRAADGTGAAETLGEEPGSQVMPTAVSPDGQTLIFGSNARNPGNPLGFDLLALPLSGERAPKPLVVTPQLDNNGIVSPDGRWFAYESEESGRREIYVRPYPDIDTGRWQISTSGGSRPVWSRNTRELYFVSADRQLMAVAVQPGKTFTYGRQTALFGVAPYYMGPLNGRTYDVAPDGRFVLVKEPASAATVTPTIVVVEHWLDEIRKRLGQ